MRLAHKVKNAGAAMLRSNLKMSAYMIFHQIFKERIVFVGHYIVIAYAGADENRFYFWQGAQLPQNFKIFAVVGNKSGAGSWRKALFSGAKTKLYLLVAGRTAEIRRRAAHIVNVPFKPRVFSHKLCFIQN